MYNWGLTGILVRAVEDDDFAGLTRLIEGCFHEYEGAYLDLNDLDKDLHAYATSLQKQKGEGIVLIEEKTGELVGTISCVPLSESVFELKRLYLASRMRGDNLAAKMLAYIENAAQRRGATAMELWTDARFGRAHRFYEREGYIQQNETRDLHDISNTTEYRYLKHFSR